METKQRISTAKAICTKEIQAHLQQFYAVFASIQAIPLGFPNWDLTPGSNGVDLVMPSEPLSSAVPEVFFELHQIVKCGFGNALTNLLRF